MVMELIVALTGASGVVYGLNLLETLRKFNNQQCIVHLIISDNAKKLLNYETESSLDDVIALAHHYYENSDLEAILASGSKMTDCMIIIPCSMSTAAKINMGIADNLITRTADVCLKEQRKLIIVPRETPLNSTHLKNLLELSQKGVLVLPAASAFYHKPKDIDDLVNFVTGKIMDNLGLEHNLFKRWPGKK